MAFISTHRAFPFCQVASRDDLPVAESAGAGAEFGYPIETTYDEFFKWFWRPRTWNATGTWTFSYAAGPIGFPTAVFSTYAGTGIFDVQSATVENFSVYDYHDREDELVCLTSGRVFASAAPCGTVTETGYEWDVGLGDYVSMGTTSHQAVAVLSIGLCGSNPRWKRNGDGFLPVLGAQVAIEVHSSTTPWEYGSSTYVGSTHLIGTGGYVRTSTTDLNDDPGYYPAENHAATSLVFAGQSVANIGHEDYYFDETINWSHDVTADIEIHEWLEQDPRDGLGPVWNSSTGERTARSMPIGPSH